MEKTLPVFVLDTYPAADQEKIDSLLKKELDQNKTKIVVLDDDPTGVQTVHDISVYTDWTPESIRNGFLDKNKVFYILTNSRGLTEDETTKIHREIGKTIASVSHETGIPYMIMSRSDSTLRGYYPLEPQLLREAMEADGFHLDGEVLCPFFKEGGRFTINNVHYVKNGDELVPAAQTEFAKDKTFGYKHSSIPEYIQEKTKGKYKAEDVICISLDDLRSMNLDKITRQLTEAENFQKICVNAIDYSDIKTFCICLYRAMADGKEFMFRTAAGLVKAAGGITDRPLLTYDEMVSPDSWNGGLVVVGSHTQKTTQQLEELLKLENVVPVAFDSDKVLESDQNFRAEIDRCLRAEEEIIKGGKTAAVYTKRTLLSLDDDTKESALQRSVKISDGVQRLVGELEVEPSFIIAKGGITSSDIGTKALKVKRANVLGQICPGIPVWQTGDESRFPNKAYVIFPGNVGDSETLKEAVEILTRK